MSEVSNGGWAFPSHGSMVEVAWEGMTLRDYFAAKALMGLIAEPFSDDAPSTSEYVGGEKLQDDLPGDVIARAAYRLADAMLRAREK